MRKNTTRHLVDLVKIDEFVETRTFERKILEIGSDHDTIFASIPRPDRMELANLLKERIRRLRVAVRSINEKVKTCSMHEELLEAYECRKNRLEHLIFRNTVLRDGIIACGKNTCNRLDGRKFRKQVRELEAQLFSKAADSL